MPILICDSKKKKKIFQKTRNRRELSESDERYLCKTSANLMFNDERVNATSL